MTFYKVWANSLFPASDFGQFSHDAGKLCRSREMKVYLDGLMRNELYGDTEISGETVEDEERRRANEAQVL